VGGVWGGGAAVGVGAAGEKGGGGRLGMLPTGGSHLSARGRVREEKRRGAGGPLWAESGDGEDHVWFEDRWMVASLCDE
jgi:hypothetical protein